MFKIELVICCNKSKKLIFYFSLIEAIFPKAHIESYVQVSFKRICDDIPHAIMGGFENNVKNDIEDVLMNIVTEEEKEVEKLLEVKYIFVATVLTQKKTF